MLVGRWWSDGWVMVGRWWAGCGSKQELVWNEGAFQAAVRAKIHEASYHV